MNARSRQRGFSMVLLTVALIGIVAVASLALDFGRLSMNKSRLQATVDAAAMSAAKVLDTTGSTASATSAANSALSLNASHQSDLNGVFGSVTKTIEYSNTLVPFSPGTTPALYVRVTLSGFSVASLLAQTVGINSLTLSANAVAGPSSTLSNACNISPLLMCGNANASAPLYGYTQGQITALKLSAGSTSTVGPGNYMLLSLGGNGANVVRQNLAGSFSACTSVGSNVTTQPGVAAGPTAQGLNTRFNEYQGGGMSASTAPPDVIVTQPSGNARLSCSDSSCATIVTGPGGNTTITNASQYSTYSYEGMYQPRVAAANYDIAPAPTSDGVVDRRVLAAPIGDCSGAAQGRTTLPVLGLACFFLLQDVDQSGNSGQVFGEVLSSCQVNGTPSATPNNNPGPYIIQLYHVDNSPQA